MVSRINELVVGGEQRVYSHSRMSIPWAKVLGNNICHVCGQRSVRVEDSGFVCAEHSLKHASAPSDVTEESSETESGAQP